MFSRSSALTFCSFFIMSIVSLKSFGLNAGDVAIISFSSDNPDRISFVALVDISAGETIRFTDSGWQTSGSFRANEGGIQYVVPAGGLDAGDVVTASSFSSGGWSTNNDGVGSNGLALSGSGDQILAFQGTGGSPSFLFSVHFDSTGYSNATTSNTTGLPVGLTLNDTAVNFSEIDNGYYNGITSGTPEQLRTSIANSSNWVTSDTYQTTLPGWNFTVDDGMQQEPALVDGVSLDNSMYGTGATATVTVFLDSPPEIGTPANIELTSGAFNSPVNLIITNPAVSNSTNVTMQNEGFWSVTATAISGAEDSASSSIVQVGNPTNPPTANGGVDKEVLLLGSSVQIQFTGASGNDPDGLAGLTYEWTPSSGVGITGWSNRTGNMTSTNSPSAAVVTINAPGVYNFTLTITDLDDNEATDNVLVTISDEPPTDIYDPPANYYNSATGTGTALEASLRSIITSGHIQQNYGNFRYNASDYDQDPNNTNNILLAYSRQSVDGDWDSGQTWNREHVWPQSKQPGTASNGSTGNLGDPHALRPVNPTINSTRGNKPFGNYGTTGSHGSQGTFYFPGDQDKGDIARQCFYSATRYSNLSLGNGNPGGDTLGDLASMIRWHFTDPPDTFERRRNHRIYLDQNNRSSVCRSSGILMGHFWWWI